MKIPALQVYNILHSLVFVIVLIAFDRVQPMEVASWATTTFQISAEVIMILLPLLVGTDKPLKLEESYRGECASIAKILTFTNITIALVISSRVIEAAGVQYSVTATGALMVLVFAGLLGILFINRPRVEDVVDTSSPIARSLTAKMLAPLALAAYYYFAGTGNATYAILSAAGLLVVYTITTILVWNRNVQWYAEKARATA